MINLKNPQLDEREYDAVLNVLKSGVIAQGPVVKEFEDAFSSKCGSKYGVAVNSGTAALHTILVGLGIGQGDEVISTSFTFIATASPILMCGAKPVFVDIEPDTYNINPEYIEERITPKTKAIIAVNLFGRLADWKKLREISDKHGVYLLEDAAQSHFAFRGGTTSGNFADVSWFSFYATKNMMTSEGGMITTDDKALVDNMKRIRQHGMSEQGMYDYKQLGYNYRMTDIAAAIGMVQLTKIDQFNKRRIEIAAIYNDAFKTLSRANLPITRETGEHVYHLYTLGLPSKSYRDQLAELLRAAGVACGIYYPRPLNEISIFDAAGSGCFLEHAKRASETVLSIPCEPTMTDEQIQTVIANVVASYRLIEV